MLGESQIGNVNNMKCEGKFFKLKFEYIFKTNNLIQNLDLEWMLHKIGAIKSNLEEDPRKKRSDNKSKTFFSVNYDDSD